MNYRVLGRILGLALVTEAALMVPSMLIGLYHGESILGFSTTIGILLIVGMLLLSFKPKDNKIFAREGFLGVSFSWILLSMFGALPFTIEKMIPDYVGAVFEVASGFTTTGSSILADSRRGLPLRAAVLAQLHQLGGRHGSAGIYNGGAAPCR